MKVSEGVRKHIVVCVDHFSKFVLLRLMEERSSETMKQWFVNHMLGPYGRPLQVRSNCGNEFSGAFDKMLRDMNVNRAVIRPHAPWANGRAERMVGTAKTCLRKIMHEYDGNGWTLLLPYLMKNLLILASPQIGKGC